MIDYKEKVFKLSTKNTSYWFHITSFGHLEQIYYGRKLPKDQGIEPLLLKRTAMLGSSVAYKEEDQTYSLDKICLEWSGIGKGDYRNAPCEIKMPDGTYTTDFIYQSHEKFKGFHPSEGLPVAYGKEEEVETLKMTLIDESNQVELNLYYSVYEKTNVITRRTIIKNKNQKPLVIKKALSLSLDMPNDCYDMVTFNGGWIKEGHKQRQKIGYGLYVNSSTTGDSSNRHNPGFLIAQQSANENQGKVYGFNLIYSGNHYGVAELSNHDLLRIQIGINPHCFEWELNQGESFESPEGVMSFSDKGLNGLSQNFHDFVNNHIVVGQWKNQERPVLINNWEAYFFDFTRGKL